MAVPGFSVSDLIQALGQVKVVYDAFFNEYTNSASQVRDLADDIDQFRENLKKHREILEVRGLEYPASDAVQRTLEACYRFLDEYKDILDKRRRKSVAGALKTARFAFEHDEIDRLRAQISRHDSNINRFSVNLLLEHSFRRPETTSPTVIATPVPIPGQSSHSISPLASPTLLGSPLLSQDSFSPTTPRRHGSTASVEWAVPPSFESPPAPITSSPQILPSYKSPVLSSPSLKASPAIQSLPINSQNSLNTPGLLLPQSALPYCVAEVYFGTKKVDLKRKPVGRDFEGGREMVIVDQDGNMRFRHRIKYPRKEIYRPSYPYTWHRRWRKDHDALEVGFKGTSPEAHAIIFKGMPALSAVPKYIFAEPKDFEDFQSELRGKHLEDTFEVRQIICASSSKHGEATDQHLKIWRDHVTQECSLSFYASAVPNAHDMEFALAMFEQQINSREEVELCLNFIGAAEPKRSRTFSKSFSRSPTERTTSSSNTTMPGVFTRNNTSIASSESSVTSANSRMSAASFQSDIGHFHTEPSETDTSVELQARRMKYLKIEFSDAIETSRFKEMYGRLYQEEICRPLNFFLNWQMNTGHQRSESIINTSPSGTPLTMSPVLRPMRGHVPKQES